MWDDAQGRLSCLELNDLLVDEECWSLAFARGRWILGTDNGRLGISDKYGRTVERWLSATDIGAIEGESTKIAHLGMIHEIDVSLDERRFASHGAMDATIRIWDLDGTMLASLKTMDIPWSSFFVSDGERLVTLTETSGVSWWSCSLPKLVERLSERTSATLLPMERQRYLGESEEVARRRYEGKEREHGRTPLPPDRTIDIDIRF